jgi:hypothetical protein
VTPDEAAAWLPILRDYLALLVGVGLGTLGVITVHYPLMVAGFALAGLAVDARSALLSRLARIVARWWQDRRAGR